MNIINYLCPEVILKIHTAQRLHSVMMVKNCLRILTSWGAHIAALFLGHNHLYSSKEVLQEL